jgi:putative aldouronate transport system permease protein
LKMTLTKNVSNKTQINNNVVKIKDKKLLQPVIEHYQLYLFLIPAITYFIIFKYIPIYGLQLAFREFNYTSEGVFSVFTGKWVGLVNFKTFVNSPSFLHIVKNTFSIAFFTLMFSFPFPIILALMLNEVRNQKFKMLVQTTTYAPHFISMVVLISIVNLFLSPSSGIVNVLLTKLGFEKIYFMIHAHWFVPIYVITQVWQHTGWSAIIYMAALAGVDKSQHEAADIDGATRIQRIVHVNIPAIMPTIVVLFIMSSGRIMHVGFEKVFLMQNPMNMEASDVISTYVYRMGIMTGEYSYATAVDLFNSVINFSILVLVNYMSKKLNGESLW